MGKTRIEIYPQLFLQEDLSQERKKDFKSLVEAKFYLIETKDHDDIFLKAELDRLGEKAFFDPLVEYWQKDNFPQIYTNYHYVVSVSWRAGVTDNTAHSLKELLEDEGLNDLTVSSGKIYFVELHSLYKKSDLISFAENHWGNNLIQKIEIDTKEEFLKKERFHNITIPRVFKNEQGKVEVISLDISDHDLEKLSQERCLALTLSELKTIKSYFEKESVKRERQDKGLSFWPTDVELEILAQTWSEHCKHKIFSAEIEYEEDTSSDFFNHYRKINSKKISGIYKEYIKKTTQDVLENKKVNWAISVFTDNAGIVRFDDNIDLCIKVETHNSPSALDPYGGALTGILGVNRDILGCGLGARPVANMDVFCFAPPSWPEKGHEEYMPENLFPPQRLLEGVHLGVEDGGNKSGIPTVNGAIYFDPSFAGKPLVFVGTVGVMPQLLSEQRKSCHKKVEIGDRIVMAGGAIGADGIHGATFSSLELNENSPVTAVQIGDPLTQKRLLDFVLEARDLNLFNAITDNGAGGLSSSVGEMAEMTMGATLDLSHASLKYPGLGPYELMISESQERMTLAVPPLKMQSFKELAHRRGVDISDLGEFHDKGYLEVLYAGERVGRLDLNFLHNGLPKMNLKAYWSQPLKRTHFYPESSKKILSLELTKDFLEESLLELLSRPNMASKEKWVRRYDHEVQGATHVRPFSGKNQKGPNDSGVIWLYPHGGKKDSAFSLGVGMNPRLSSIDPYLMAQYAVDEALRNCVSTGGDPETCCLLDNFCWPDPIFTEKNPEGKQKLAALVRCSEGLRDTCLSYFLPLVSGKDSMKNDFKGKNKKGDPLSISILPTLLVTAMSKVTMGKTCQSQFKNEGDLIYLINPSISPSLLGSEWGEIFELENSSSQFLKEIDLDKNFQIYKKIHQAISQGVLSSCHDVSDGGPLCTLVESMIGNSCGADIHLGNNATWETCFNEMAGQFIISVSKKNLKDFQKIFKDDEYTLWGETNHSELLSLNYGTNGHLVIPIQKLTQAWTGAF